MVLNVGLNEYNSVNINLSSFTVWKEDLTIQYPMNGMAKLLLSRMFVEESCVVLSL